MATGNLGRFGTNGRWSFGAFLLGSLVLSACASKGPAETTPSAIEMTKEAQVSDATPFLERYHKEHAALERALNDAFWAAANSGADADFKAYAEANLALRAYHSDTERYAQLKGYITASEAGGFSSQQRRELAVADLAYKGNQLPKDLLKDMVQRSSSIEQTFNTFRPTFEQKIASNNDLLDVLRKSTELDRREAAWKALKEVGAAVATDLVALAKVRNQAALSLGYANYWEMKIRLQEHDPDMLLALFAELEAETNEPFRAMKAKLDAEQGQRLGLTPEQLMPWHYDNPFFQSPPPSAAVNSDIFYEHMPKEAIVELSKTFFADIGLSMEDLAANSDLYEREGKDQHAFCITMDRGGDVRMLLNIQPTQDWMDTMLHEAGHAVYYKFIDRSLPFNLREASHIFTTEAIAMMFGALGKNPTWLTGYAGADPAKVAAAAPALAEQRQREQLIFARWAMVMFRFEKTLYEDPDQDLNTAWYDLVERLQLLKRPEGRNAPDWAAKPHFTIAPVYYHNYLLGELFAAQLRDKLAKMAKHEGPRAELSWNGRKDFGTFLINEVFKPGMTTPWPTFVANATGSPLSAAAFAAEVK